MKITALHRVLLAALLAAFAACGGAMAQGEWSQSTACPGWNNPASFTSTGSSGDYKYEGFLGYTDCSKAPNVKTAETGINWTGGTVVAGQMATKTVSTGGDCATVTSNKPYVIYNATDKIGSHPVNRDPMTEDELPFVPTDFNTSEDDGQVPTALTRSVRIGDACGRPGDDVNANGLRYSMYVTEQNAMLFIYYAAVIESPGFSYSHGLKEDPAVIIRVMKQNSAGKWVQASPNNPNSQTDSDTLAYMVSSTSKSMGGTVEDGKGGWHACSVSPDDGGWWGDYSIYWKEWTKVAINLSGLLYENVRIEVMISDCCWTQHFSYAYVCGECRPMTIRNNGCPAGMATDVATLAAPRGLDNYVWFASEYGVSEPANNCEPGKDNAYFTFRQLTPDEGKEADSAYIYKVQASDFKVTKSGMSAGSTVTVDSVGPTQTFRCTMTSALDPAKPFKTNLYVNVTNTKPTMRIDTLSLCGGDVELKNLSFVPGNEADGVDLSSTTWTFYNNPECLGVSDSVFTGQQLTAHYTDGELKGIKVRTNAVVDDDSECYSEAIYPIRPLPNPVAGMTLSKQVLCDDDEVTLTDACPTSTERFWVFLDQDDEDATAPTDTLRQSGDERQVTRPFTHSIEPIDLIVRNGLYYMAEADTVWCADTVRDSVFVFLHPELEVLGDTIVCNGTLTDATVNAIGVDGCSYEWSTSNGSITGGLPSGTHLAVTPYADTATYYVRVTSPQGCVAWDSIHAYLVVPRLQMLPADGKICPGDSVVLIGSHAQSYTWTAAPTDLSLAGQEEEERIVVYPDRNTTYTLTGHGGTGENRCDATPLKAQVRVYPYPESNVLLDPGIVDSDDPTVTLTDASAYAVSSSWLFNGGLAEEGRVVTHTFDEATGTDSVYVTLTSTNELGCVTVYPFAIPVNMFTAWFPNSFTPGSEDENAVFRLYTINDYEYFHIYIYNRGGQLVYESNDPAFEWDGTRDGRALPQGGYVYMCRYRKPGTYNVNSLTGSVSLIR